ncbi:MAG: DUF494 family protein [Melioribacteraceae bacterium]
MTAKIVEVLAKILEGLGNNYSLEEVTTLLKSNKEYDEQIVSAAFSLVFDKVLANKMGIKKNRNSNKKNFRILSSEEVSLVGIQNYNYIQHLVNIGLLDSMDVESIVDQVTAMPYEDLSKDDINWMILYPLVDIESEILPGSRVILYSSDRIN